MHPPSFLVSLPWPNQPSCFAPWSPSSLEVTCSQGQRPGYSTSPPFTLMKITTRVMGMWQASVMWDAEELAKGTGGGGDINCSPDDCLSSLWLKSLFSGQTMWTTIGRKFINLRMIWWRGFQSKTSPCSRIFTSARQIHSSLASVDMGIPQARRTEPRVVFWKRKKGKSYWVH